MVTKSDDKEDCIECIVPEMNRQICDKCKTERDKIEVKKFYTPREESEEKV